MGVFIISWNFLAVKFFLFFENMLTFLFFCVIMFLEALGAASQQLPKLQLNCKSNCAKGSGAVTSFYLKK